MSEIARIAALEAIPRSEERVFVVDRALPDWIRAALPEPIEVEGGERLKTLSEVGRLAELILERRPTRPLTIVAVGGGSIGDAVGFLASVLWRGVGLEHVPTTLIAMVDSAHGGKTAVNLGAAKNQLGTFYPAEVVWLVDEIARRMPTSLRADGLSELIKGLWLGDAEALSELDGRQIERLAGAPFEEVGEALMGLIERAIRVKETIVERDPRETQGIRTFLNFGHTAAHALELCHGLSHGAAVAWGMAAAARVSNEEAGLSAEQAERLSAHLVPLLRPIPGASIDGRAFLAAVGRDKKRAGARLRSVVLDAPGSPRVTSSIEPERWLKAARAAHAAWRRAPIRLNWSSPLAATIELGPSKSELNRALTIAHLSPARYAIEAGLSRADDVALLARALESIERGADEVYVGLGGTTLHFTLAAAAAAARPMTVRAEPPLLARPHDGLLDALGALGARADRIEGGFAIDASRSAFFADEARPHDGPVVRVDVSRSSQYASAIALIAASGRALTIALATGGERFEPSRAVSMPYFELTLSMVSGVGLEVTDLGEGRTQIGGAPVEARVRVGQDASSAAFWTAASALGVRAELCGFEASTSLQPDARAVVWVESLASGGADRRVEADLSDAPDLAPVLAALAALSEPALLIRGAAHLRAKESNRIDDLIASLAGVGIEAEAREDGLMIPAGRQAPRAGARWSTHNDHRLAMAGALFARAAPLVIEDPWVVTKSYPDFWRDLQKAGAYVEPA